jgi:hypothetical protein
VIDLSAASTENSRHRVLIGVPFFVLMAVVAPVLTLLAPVVLFACLVVGANPMNVARVVWGVLTALRGTHVEVTGRDRSVLVHRS